MRGNSGNGAGEQAKLAKTSQFRVEVEASNDATPSQMEKSLREAVGRMKGVERVKVVRKW